jgi:hypothetical protein
MKQDLETELIILARINMRKALERDFQPWFACLVAKHGRRSPGCAIRHDGRYDDGGSRGRCDR